MEDKELHNFSFISTFLTDIETLDYEQQTKIIYGICYWGVYRELPLESKDDPLVKAFLNNAKRMIEGQKIYKEEKSEQGKKGGVQAKFSDEDIINAYITLYQQNNGVYPTEQDVIKYCGGGVQRINKRKGWIDREIYLRKWINDNSEKHFEF